MKSHLELSRKARNNINGWLFILPLVVYFLLFQLAPIVLSFFYSLTDWNGYSDSYTFVGLENYYQAITNAILYPDFWPSVGTTFLYVIYTVPLSLILALVVAALLNSKIKGERFFKTCFYIPSVTASVAVSAMWIYMLDPTYGIVGAINQAFGTSINLLNSRSTALFTLALMSVWGGLGYNVLIVLSAMKNINPQLYEACEVDGGGAIRKFFHVTIPGVLPTLFFLLITSTIGSLQAFDQMYLMTDGAYGTTTVMLEIYSLYADHSQVGMASAMSYILFLFIMVFVAIQYTAFPQGDQTKKNKRRKAHGDTLRLMLELQAEKN